ncbi:NAD-dependent epimerase/dehydratase family protein [Nonomuraea sp. NN258]|uniref:NAD-dependent epimerase/dehydratase family protein n=1 Tax=Nonomuraea antri TaxID=2730852 RepID=UPI001569AFEB|nr:NAD-dependent epimerase/dehydratase family protein [Nonomuraea antri]NRQ34555.1 NAD-dependent epimerase/dehydratase family protein [Nonomuraea antri]
MRLLILGGGWFLGRALAEQAGQRGHQVTAFTRGKSSSSVPHATLLLGDRSNPMDMTELAAQGPWDAVLDTSGMKPAMVEISARTLANATDRYVYVSTVNVYQHWPTQPLDDDSPIRQYQLFGPPGESRTDEYGREKAGCELAVSSVFGDRATLLRPSVILGPREYVGRVPWWLRRIAAGGRVLAPGMPQWPIQPVDVRDVAAFALDAAERHLTGSYNIAAPIGHATFGDLLDACRKETGSDAVLEWLPHDFLQAQGVREWTELPLWRPYLGTWQVDAARARAVGLVCRPLADTVADTWAWLCEGGSLLVHERAARLGITPEREAAILAAWDARPV